MKENNGMKTQIVNLKEYSSNDVGILVQVILIELLIIFAIINLIVDIFMPVFYVILTMLMFVMAYNNHKIFKRKNMTPLYIIVGIFVLISTIVEYLI